MSAKARVRRTNFMLDIALFVICILLLTPLILLIANGFKTPQEMLVWPPTLLPKDPTLQNFQKVFTETPLLRWMFNSFAFAILSTIAIVSTSALAGYIIGKFIIIIAITISISINAFSWIKWKLIRIITTTVCITITPFRSI